MGGIYPVYYYYPSLWWLMSGPERYSWCLNVVTITLNVFGSQIIFCILGIYILSNTNWIALCRNLTHPLFWTYGKWDQNSVLLLYVPIMYIYMQWKFINCLFECIQSKYETTQRQNKYYMFAAFLWLEWSHALNCPMCYLGLKRSTVNQPILSGRRWPGSSVIKIQIQII